MRLAEGLTPAARNRYAGVGAEGEFDELEVVV